MYVKHETSGCNEKKEVSQVAQMKRVWANITWLDDEKLNGLLFD